MRAGWGGGREGGPSKTTVRKISKSAGLFQFYIYSVYAPSNQPFLNASKGLSNERNILSILMSCYKESQG